MKRPSAENRVSQRRVESFTAAIRNRHTRRVYGLALARFTAWLEARRVFLDRVDPALVTAYVEALQRQLSASSVNLHLAAVRRLFADLVAAGVVPHNPAASFRGPKNLAKAGKTAALSEREAGALIASIDTTNLLGLRDRALIAVMIYALARVGAVVGMQVRDYDTQGSEALLRLHEEEGECHQVPVHHRAGEMLDAYLKAAGIRGESRSPLFRASLGRTGRLTEEGLSAGAVLRIVKRRAVAARLRREICCHSLRATGITSFLANGGELSGAQKIAGHESPRTTQRYDATRKELTSDEVERIRIEEVRETREELAVQLL